MEFGTGAVSSEVVVGLVDVVRLLLDLDGRIPFFDDPDAVQLDELLTQYRRHAFIESAVPASGRSHHTDDGSQRRCDEPLDEMQDDSVQFDSLD